MIQINRFQIGIDTVLLLALTTSHMWFSDLNSAFVVLLAVLYLIVDLASPQLPDEVDEPTRGIKYSYLARLFILLLAILLTVVVPTAYNMLQRHEEGLGTHAHDGLIQIELAVGYILDGKNPYTENYENTPLVDRMEASAIYRENPAPLYHFVYLPFMFLMSIPLDLLVRSMSGGWYDQRLLYLLFFYVMLGLIPLLVQKQRDQLSLTVLLGMNMLFSYFIAEGRNDVLILVGLMLATIALRYGWLKSSMIFVALMLATKHQAWFFLPFYLVYIRPKQFDRETVGRWLLSLWPLALVTIGLILPFILWDPASFFADTIGYILGWSEYSYPVKGVGFSQFLLSFGLVTDYGNELPLGMISMSLGLISLFFTLRWEWKRPTLANMWLAFVIFAFVFQYFGRFMNDNYYLFLLQALFVALYVAPPINELKASDR